ncbi:DUF4184 family protein [Flavobacterium sp. 83]|uniref:DUF4184 family protein n=1 Tax=Flavobacterium sp. 83 TaxID=1131812 RepID=UPI00068A5E9A|nr:DUF4184 family protein [Flavobacterium sp. 83]
MPFTFSHPAIVLPFFKNKKWSITGLIIGSMAPDFEFFFRMRTQSEISHTFHGLLLIDFPLAIIVVILFHGILKKSLISNSPDFVQNRLVELKNSNWFDYFKKNSFIVILSFFVGAFSHFFWDSLTHWDGYVVQRVSFLNILLFSFPIYDWIQYISSIVGLVALGLCFFKIPQNSDSTSNVSLVFWIITLFFASIVVFLRFTLVVGWHRVADIIIGVLSSIVIALTFTSVIFMKYKRS